MLFTALRASKRNVFATANELKDVRFLLSGDAGMINPEPILKVLTNLYRVCGSQQAAEEMKRFQKGVGFGVVRTWITGIDNYFNNFMQNLTKDIVNTTWKQITNTVNKGLTEGKTYDDIIRDLKSPTLDKMRAARIARTESNKAMNHGKFIATEKLPFPAKLEWIAGRDNRTRGKDDKDKTDHYHMNGQQVDRGSLFKDPRSGAMMLHPGDTTNGAGAGDVVNCRCAVRVIRVRGNN